MEYLHLCIGIACNWYTLYGDIHVTDFVMGTSEISISHEDLHPQVVDVTFLVDNIAQEGNETFYLELYPSHSTTIPNEGRIFFINIIEMIIIDSDGEHMSMHGYACIN